MKGAEQAMVDASELKARLQRVEQTIDAARAYSNQRPERSPRLQRVEQTIDAAHEVLEQQVVVSENLANQQLAQAHAISDLQARVVELEQRLGIRKAG